MIGVFAASAEGRTVAAELNARFGPDVAIVEGPVGPAVRRMWSELDAAVLVTSTEAAVRTIAPLLRDELTDPAVVCVDDRRRHAVVVAGGAGGSADALAEQVADVLDCEPVGTGSTGRDTAVLDEIVHLTRATVVGDLPGCAAAVLGGEPVELVNPLGFALPPLPGNAAAGVAHPVWRLVIDDRRPSEPDPAGTVRLIPRTLVVGIGARGDAGRTAVTDTVALLDTEHGLDPRAVRACASNESKAEQPAVVDAVQDLQFWNAPEGDEVPLLRLPAEVLDAVPVPNPSELVRRSSGSGSVAEAAALHAAGQMGPAELAVAKTSDRGVTVAAARVLPRGRLAVVDIGPGEHDLRTPRADAELRRASVVAGSGADVNRVRHLLRAGTEVLALTATSPTDVLDACWERARAGCAVAVVGSAGSGIADAGRIGRERADPTVELVVVPGVPHGGFHDFP